MNNMGRQKMNKPAIFVSCIGVLLVVIISLVLSGIIAAFVSDERLSLHTAKLLIPIIQFISVLFGGIFAGKNAYGNKIIAVGTVGGVYYLTLIGVSALILNGISEEFWIGMIAIIAGCLCAFLISARKKSTIKRGKHRRVYS